ncbi:MAG: nucleotidyl transferase AbiEii/AbiGii toxin family protein [Nitriliruptor sp.]|uniref:nucleotidyl transferase AbiEii/AbiGii toxin family protein n=1 Tax=Nitriliruptor sp. TaxID=2448056 RepID=UPI0034A0A1D3
MTFQDPAADIYRALQRHGRAHGRPTDELLHLYALEGFLARLATHEHRDRLILKGGMLLAAFGTRRPTRDVDLQAQELDNEAEHLRELVADIAVIAMPDGLQFDTNTISAEIIRDTDAYAGERISLDAALATGRMQLKVDISVGDPIWPAPTEVAIDRLLDGDPIRLRGYPLHMVYAEKLVTAIQRGTASTRWRDFADVYLLSRQHDQPAQALRAAIVAVAEYRQVTLAPLRDVLAGYPEIAQAKWAAWRRRQRLDDRLPPDFGDVLDHVIAFADRIIDDSTPAGTWRAHTAEWR